MSVKYVLDRLHYLLQSLPNSTWAERILLCGPDADTQYSVVVDGFEDSDKMLLVCRRIREKAGCSVKLVELSAAQPALPPVPSAAAGSLRPRADEPLLQPERLSPWYTALLSHLFLSAAPAQCLVLFGPPGCGKTLAVERAFAMKQMAAVPHMYVSGAEDGDDETNMLLLAKQFLGSAGSRSDAVFVLDDIEAFASGDRAAKFLGVIEAAKCRRVIICNDSYGQRTRPLRKKPAQYKFLEAPGVTKDALHRHLRDKFPALSLPQRTVVVENARGDVRAAQLAAELESRVPPAVTVAGEQQRRTAADEQHHGALHADIVRCMRPSVVYDASRGSVHNQRAKAVVERCSVLLRPRAVDAIKLMESNYARLGEPDDLETLAAMADDLSSAAVYRYRVTDAMMADKFSRLTPDDSIDDNFKDQLMFDVAVVLPCVRAARRDRDARPRSLVLEFPEYAHLAAVRRTVQLCRRIDVRHEVAVRALLAIDPANDDPLVRQQALLRVSVSLSNAAVHRDFMVYGKKSVGAAAGNKASDDESDDDDGEGGGAGKGSAGTGLTIGQLERTLFVFPLLVGATVWSDGVQRKAAIARCTAYGFDGDSFVCAAKMFLPAYAGDESTLRRFFLDAKSTVLDANEGATRPTVTDLRTGATIDAPRTAAVGATKRLAPRQSAAQKKPKKTTALLFEQEAGAMSRFLGSLKHTKSDGV